MRLEAAKEEFCLHQQNTLDCVERVSADPGGGDPWRNYTGEFYEMENGFGNLAYSEIQQ